MIRLILLTIIAGCITTSCTPEAEKAGKTIDEVDIINPLDPGEGDKPVDSEIPQAMITTAGATELMVQKAIAYREASGSATHRNGIYVYSGATFDKLLTDNGGIALNTAGDTANGDQYITSTEVPESDHLSSSTNPCGSEVYSVRFGKVALNKDTKKTGETRYIRAVKKVTK